MGKKGTAGYRTDCKLHRYLDPRLLGELAEVMVQSAAATTTRCFRASSCRWPAAPEHGRRSRRARDVLAQRVRLALYLVQALLDHVADAHDPAQPAVALERVVLAHYDIMPLSQN